MIIKPIKKIYTCFIVILELILMVNTVKATEGFVDKAKETYKLGEVIDILDEYVEDIDLEELSTSLIEGGGLNVNSLFSWLLNMLFKEIRYELKTFVTIFTVITLLAIIKCFELEKGSLENIINIIGVLLIASIILKNYVGVLDIFKTTVTRIINITEIISPVVLGILIATGEVITSGIIGPVIMFLTSLVGIVVNTVILPLLNISLIFKIISGIGDAINLNKIGSFLNKSAMWLVSIIFAVVLGVLGLETSISSSVDEVTVKTAQIAVTNLIPVVGKFVSDSTELIIGASEIIGKTIGVISIIVILIVLLLPVIKILLISVIYALLEGISEMLLKEGKISKMMGEFSKQYKIMAGIMVGIGSVFVITLALAITLFGKAVGG